MSEPPASMGYVVKIQPTEAELNLILRLRQVSGLAVVDSDSMTLYECGKPEYLNGKRGKTPVAGFWLAPDA